MKSVLTAAGRPRVISEPFPHVVIENAFDDDLCMELLEQFPPLEVVAQGAELGSNTRFSLPAHLALIRQLTGEPPPRRRSRRAAAPRQAVSV